MAFTILILDDEELIRDYIKDLVQEFLPESTIFETGQHEVALEFIQKNAIDILFLDISMPQMDGFQFLQLVPDREFELVFITAYSSYGIDAIKAGAFDYLLKPIKKQDFKESLDKLVAKLEEKKKLPAIINEDYLNSKLSLNHQQGLVLVSLKEIIYLKANNTYTVLYLTNGTRVTVAKAISKFEKKLSSTWFIRVHKSFIINLCHLKEYSTKEGGVAIMDNSDKLTVSRYKLQDLFTAIRNISGELKI